MNCLKALNFLKAVNCLKAVHFSKQKGNTDHFLKYFHTDENQNIVVMYWYQSFITIKQEETCLPTNSPQLEIINGKVDVSQNKSVSWRQWSRLQTRNFVSSNPKTSREYSLNKVNHTKYEGQTSFSFKISITFADPSPPPMNLLDKSNHCMNFEEPCVVWNSMVREKNSFYMSCAFWKM